MKLMFLIFIILFSSCNTYKLKQADKKFRKKQYATAGELYREVYHKTSGKAKKAYIAFRIGESFRNISYYNRAMTGYKNAMRYLYPDSLLYLRLAQTHHVTGLYRDAINYYQKHLLLNPQHIVAQNGLKGCLLAQEQLSNPKQYSIQLISSLQSNRSDFNPFFVSGNYEKLYFLSSRQLNQHDKTDPATGQPYPQLYISHKDKDEKWEKPLPAETKNTIPAGAKSQHNKITMEYSAISPDGKYLYFASDKAGGYGGMDIYKAPLLRDSIGSWENLGPQINTPGNEIAPYITPTNTLYFSSDGHPGLGGLDIFKATQDKNGEWKVLNIGYPINSCADDVGFLTENHEEKGLFCSNRNNTKGFYSIYSFQYIIPEIYLEGSIRNIMEEDISDSTLRIVGDNGFSQTKTLSNSCYSLRIEPDVSYSIMVSATGYMNQSITFRTLPDKESETYMLNFSLIPAVSFSLPSSLLFDSGSAIPGEKARPLVESLVKSLLQHSDVSLEITAHTDRHGDEQYNQHLSNQRAHSIKQILVGSGIDENRLITTGYGKTRPKTITEKEYGLYNFLPESNLLTEQFIEKSLTKEQQVVADQLNRRVEFRFIYSQL